MGTQDEELRRIYALDVAVIPTNRPMVRIDYPDAVFPTRRDKERAVLNEIRIIHQTGRPVLVGTASVRESERLSAMLRDMPRDLPGDLPGALQHQVLNAKHEEQEAALIAGAGQHGAITISTKWPAGE